MTVRMIYLMVARLAGSMALMLRQEIGVLWRQHSRANAYAERWVRTARRSHRLDADRRAAAPALVLDEYVAHYNQQCSHRARYLRPPDRGQSITAPVSDLAAVRILRHKILGGLIHEYERAA